MKSEISELMSRIEEKRRELELAVERTKRDHAGVTTEDADSIKKNLDYLTEILREGVENLSDETIQKLEEWLPETSSKP